MQELIDAMTTMSIGQLAGSGTLLVLIVCACFEIAPIKINPISSILAWFGKKINGPLIQKVEKLETKIEEIGETVDANEIDRIRWEILDFANSCRNHRRHTYGEFIHIIDLNEKYHRVLEKRNMTNGQIDAEYAWILALFRKCQEDDDFL